MTVHEVVLDLHDQFLKHLDTLGYTAEEKAIFMRNAPDKDTTIDTLFQFVRYFKANLYISIVPHVELEGHY